MCYDNQKKIDKHINLVKQAKKGKNTAFYQLLRNYEPLIINYTNKFKYLYPNVPLDWNDIKQQISISFWELVNNYDVSSQKSFPAFIKQFLLWKSHEEMRKYANNSMKTLNYSNFSDEDNDFKSYDKKETLDITSYKNILTLQEYEVINLLHQGYKINEISFITKKSNESIYQFKHKAIKKMKIEYKKTGYI